MRANILVCDYVDAILLKSLRSDGHQVIYAPEIQMDEVRLWLPNMSGIVVNTRTPIDGDLMRSCPDLRFIGRLGIGLDIFDEEQASRSGIRIFNTPGANANAVGEHMFGMLLSLLRNIPAANTSVRDKAWLREKHRGTEIGGMTIGIVGFGHTGSSFGSKFANWQTKVLAYDKYKERYADELRFVQETTLEAVIEESDVISFHVPLTSETLHMVDMDFIARCKPGVIILNAARGKVVDLEALVQGLELGKIGGACLDVLENEKLHTYTDKEKALFEKLCGMNNVLLTPHIAGWTYDSKRNIARQLLSSIRHLYDSKKG